MPTAPLPLFVINLACAMERRARILELLLQCGLEPIIVPAVDGHALDAAAKTWWQADPLRAKLNPGEIGCLLSHRNIWQQIVDEELAGAVVLEDDVFLREGFAEVLPVLAAPLPALGLIRLEGDHREVIIRRKAAASVAGHSCHMMRRDGPLSSAAYAISRQMAERLLAAAPDFCVPVDAELFAASRASLPDLVTYQLEPAICTQGEFDPALINAHPCLTSTIAQFGDRADHRLGLKRRNHNRLRLRLLRPAYRLLRNLALAPSSWRRFVPSRENG